MQDFAFHVDKERRRPDGTMSCAGGMLRADSAETLMAQLRRRWPEAAYIEIRAPIADGALGAALCRHGRDEG